MIKRSISGLMLLLLMALFFVKAGYSTGITVMFVLNMLVFSELVRIFGAGRPLIILSLCLTVLCFFSGVMRPDTMLPVFFFSLSIFFIYSIVRDNSGLDHMILFCYQFLLINTMFVCATHLFVSRSRDLLLYVLLLVFLYDTSAYFFGVRFGTNRITPVISPKKSWEGLLGATFTVLVAAIFFIYNTELYPRSVLGFITVILVIFAPAGDLAISILKRNRGVKDSGSIIPGHGGILDRVDSFIFLIPIIYFLGEHYVWFN
ncbi:MAG: phosphatidate cytidylyltransferase [Candidatus Muiribacteriaceae bacterium]